jgi:hypothetical protein
MSFNRLIYDTDTYSHLLKENDGVLDYVLKPDKHYRKKNCRIERGIVGGNDVSKISGNLVDLESDLFGITRLSSLAPTNQYSSNCAFTDLNNCKADNILIRGSPKTQKRVIDTNLNNMNSCSLINYKPRLGPVSIEVPSCSNQNYNVLGKDKKQ